MIWAIEHWTGREWKPGAGYLHLSREQARRSLKWARKQFPEMKFRIRSYVARKYIYDTAPREN